MEHSELMADLGELNDKVAEGYERECGKVGVGVGACRLCGSGISL